MHQNSPQCERISQALGSLYHTNARVDPTWSEARERIYSQRDSTAFPTIEIRALLHLLHHPGDVIVAGCRPSECTAGPTGPENSSCARTTRSPRAREIRGRLANGAGQSRRDPGCAQFANYVPE